MGKLGTSFTPADIAAALGFAFDNSEQLFRNAPFNAWSKFKPVDNRGHFYAYPGQTVSWTNSWNENGVSNVDYPWWVGRPTLTTQDYSHIVQKFITLCGVNVPVVDASYSFSQAALWPGGTNVYGAIKAIMDLPAGHADAPFHWAYGTNCRAQLTEASPGRIGDLINYNNEAQGFEATAYPSKINLADPNTTVPAFAVETGDSGAGDALAIAEFPLLTANRGQLHLGCAVYQGNTLRQAFTAEDTWDEIDNRALFTVPASWQVGAYQIYPFLTDGTRYFPLWEGPFELTIEKRLPFSCDLDTDIVLAYLPGGDTRTRDQLLPLYDYPGDGVQRYVVEFTDDPVLVIGATLHNTDMTALTLKASDFSTVNNAGAVNPATIRLANNAGAGVSEFTIPAGGAVTVWVECSTYFTNSAGVVVAPDEEYPSMAQYIGSGYAGWGYTATANIRYKGIDLFPGGYGIEFAGYYLGANHQGRFIARID